MNENNEISQIDKEIDEKLSYEFENNKRIADCLNQFERIVENDPSFIEPLVIKKRDQRFILDLVTLKINYIKEALIDENSLQELALMIFELLFLLKYKPNYDQLDEKISNFQEIMNILADKPEEQKEKILIDEVLSEKKIWKDLINEISGRYGAVGFFFCVIIKFSKNKEDIIKFFIYFLKISYTCFVRFDYKELKELPEEIIVKNLYDIFKDNKDGFELRIIDKKIKKIPLDENQIQKALKNEREGLSSGKHNLKNIIKKSEEKEIIKTSNQIKDSADNKHGKEISKSIEDETEKEANKEQKNFLKDEINNMEKRINRLEKKMKTLNRNTYKLQTDLADVKEDIKQIKDRGAFQAFIDFFYRELKLIGKSDYVDKIDDILYELDLFGDFKTYDELKAEKVRTLLRKCYEKYKLGNNDSTDYMDLIKSDLDQIFELLDLENENSDVQKRLRK